MLSTLSPEAFYYRLQASRLRPQAFTQWQAYRRQVTDLLLENCHAGKTLAIFGAGHCNDVDLARLAAHFRQLTLIDINKSAMEAALRQYQLTAAAGIRLLTRDFVGIEDEDYIAYLAALWQDRESFPLQKEDEDAGAASRALAQLNVMYEKARRHQLDFGRRQYDYALVLNVHSQLNDTADWLLTEICRDDERLYRLSRLLAERIGCETGKLIRKFNDAVFAAVKEKVFIGYETGVRGFAGSGVEGALQTREDLRVRELSGEIRSAGCTDLIWPYDPSRQIVFSIALETFLL